MSILILGIIILIPVVFYLICSNSGGKSSNKTASKAGFWSRQFQIQTTSKQKIFDWIFGVGLPLICFVFDPVVFKGSGFRGALLGNFKPFAYILSFISVMAMSAWLIWGAKLKWFNAFLAGIFAVGGIISLIVGIILIPFSLIGLIILIGILGFTPLLSAIGFLRNAVRAFHAAKPFIEKPILIYSMVLSAIFSLTLPAVVNLQIKRSLDNVRNGDVEMIRAELKTLKYAAPLTNFDDLAFEYYRVPPQERKSERIQALAELYREITGKNIENSAVLMD